MQDARPTSRILKLSFSMSIATVLALMLVVVLTAEPAEATAYTATVSGNWSDPTKWSPNGVPGSAAGDTVSIPGFTMTMDYAMPNNLAGFSNGGTLNFAAGGTLRIGAGTNNSSGTINLTAGNLIVNAATLSTTGSFNDSGGTLTGQTGGILDCNGCAMNIGGTTLTITGIIINSTGTIVFATSGTLNMGGGAVINVNAPGIFDIQSNGAFNWITNPPVSINVASGATLKKTTVAGTTSFGGVNLNNNGTVEAQVGTIRIPTGTSSGTFTAMLPQTIEFNSATHTVNGASAGGNGVVLNGGTITGTGGFTIPANATMTWSSGSMTGTGTTTVALSGTLNITGGVTMNARILDNFGDVVFSASGGALSMGGAAAINNKPSGVFDAQNAANTDFFWATNPPVNFNNEGLFQKTTTAGGITRFNGVLFNNVGGTVDAQVGVIQIQGGTSTGTFTATAPAAVQFATSTHTMNGATVTGNGVTLNGGTINGTALTIQSGAVMTWSAGTMTGVTTDLTTVANGGTLKISGPVTLNARTLSNNGTIDWNAAGASFSLGGAATLNNNVGAFFDDNNTVNAQLFWATNPPVNINNAGTFRKLAGATAVTKFGVLLNNSGTVEAQVGTLEIAGGGTSTGLFTAPATASVAFNSGTHTMNGATVGGAGVRLNGGTINGPAFTIPAGATFIWSSGMMTGATTDLTTVAPGGTMQIAGAVTQNARRIDNNGTVVFSSGGATYSMGGGCTFNNNASGIFDDQNTVNASLFWATNPPVNFNNAGIFKKTAGAAATTRFNGVLLNNSGTVHAQVGTIAVEGGASSGVFTATAPSAVVFDSATHTMSGGSVGGDGVRLAGGTINGPNFVIPAGATFTWTNGTMTGSLTDTTTVAAGGTVVVNGAVTLNARTFDNNGLVSFISSGASFSFGGGAVFNNNAGGVFDAQNATTTSLFWATNPPTTFNNAGLFKKTTTGAAGRTIFNGVNLNNSGTVDAQIGTIEVRGGTSTGSFTTAAGAFVEFTTSTHTLNAPASLNGPGIRFASGTLTGTGINIAGGGTLTWTGGTMTGTGQITTVSAGGKIILAGSVTLNARTLSNSGTVIFSSGGTFNLGGGAIFSNNAGGVFDDQNTVNDQILWATNPPVQFNNAGIVKKTATAGTTTTFNGVPLNNSGTVDAQAGTIRIETGSSSGTFNTATNAAIHFVSGTHTISTGNSLTGTGTVLLAGGAISAPAGLNVNGGTFGGAGTVTGNVTNNAIVAPGASPGTLTVSGNYTQSTTGSLNIEIGGATPGSQYDRLAVTGAATLGGTFNAVLIGGFTPAGGQTFTPLTFASRSGDFAVKNLPTFAGGGSFNSSYTPTALVLTAIVTNTDLAVSQATAPATASQGQNVVFTITVTNGPSLNATNVVLTDTFSGAAFVSATASQGSCTGTGPVTCNLGTVPINSSATITLTLNANATGTISNTASVTATEPDANNANNSSTATVTVNPSSDIAIAKSVASSPVAGGTVVYSIVVSNAGPSAAANVIVNDPTPAGLTFVSNSGACTTAFPCTISSIANGSSATITTTFAVPPSASGSVTNSATASLGSDPNTANNTSTVAAAIQQLADVQIVKSGPSNAAPGSDVVYSIAVKNAGPSNAADVTVTDPTPAGVTLVSVTGACTSFPCSLGTMTPGQVATITVRYKTSGNGGGSVTNTASVSSTTPDPATSNNTASATTSLACNNEAPAFLSPENGKTNVPTTGRLVWQNTRATIYSVYLGRADQGGCSVPFGSSSEAFLDYSGLQPNTTYAWKVIAITSGCPDRESSCATFTTAANCDLRVTLVKPLGGTATSPIEFEWLPLAGATEYTVFARTGSGSFAEIGRTAATKLTAVLATDGVVEWFVSAAVAGCPNVRSATASFNICNAPGAPSARVVGETTSAKTYNVEWDAVPNAVRYEVDEATNPNFTGATTTSTTGTSLAFKHDATDTPLAFYYRVRAFSACTANPSPNSPAIRIVIIPLPKQNATNPNVNVPAGSTELVVQQVFIPGETSQPAFFNATTDRPWLSVRPPAGSLPPEGITLEVIADPRTLPNGTFTATVIVTITTPQTIGGNGTSTTSKPISISLVTPVTPVQNKPAPSSDSLIIPSIGHLDGVNSSWQSDIRITNTGLQTAKYALTFTPSAGTASGIKQTTITVDAGATTALDDIVKNWFGIGSLGDSANGMLEIRSADGAPLTAVASSRTYNVTDNGTLGQFIPALPFSGFIGRALQNAGATALSMQQISQSSLFRTNVGLVEASGSPANVLMSVFNATGTKLADIPIQLAGGEQRQLNSVLATNNISLTDGRIEVKVTSGDGKVTAYSSVVDNQTNDPLLVTGVPLTQATNSKYVLPGVADLTNALASWRTDMRIFNAALASQNASLTLYPLGGGAPLQATVSLQPGEVRTLDDVVKSLFKASNVGGAVHVETSSQANLVVTGRTYNQTSEGTFGQFIEAVTPDKAVGAGGRTLHVLQVEDSTRYRTNLGIAEVTGNAATVEVMIVLPDSKVTPTITFPLAANEFRQLGVIRDLNLGNVYNARIAIRVISGAGRVTAYGSVVDMLTQDPTYVPAQ